MGLTLKGFENVEKTLEAKYGKAKMRKIVDKALIIGGNVVVQIIKNNMKTFEDTGKSVAQTTLSKPMTINGVRTVKIYWKGDRETVIHLNENGHYDKAGKWVDTKGKGVIERALIQGREAYFRAVKRELS